MSWRPACVLVLRCWPWRRQNPRDRMPFKKETRLAEHAKGTFEVKVIPQPPDDKDDPNLGRFLLDKQFHGDLEGTSTHRNDDRRDARNVGYCRAGFRDRRVGRDQRKVDDYGCGQKAFLRVRVFAALALIRKGLPVACRAQAQARRPNNATRPGNLSFAFTPRFVVRGSPPRPSRHLSHRCPEPGSESNRDTSGS